jgi:hypothetical protein
MITSDYLRSAVVRESVIFVIATSFEVLKAGISTFNVGAMAHATK